METINYNHKLWGKILDKVTTPGEKEVLQLFIKGRMEGTEIDPNKDLMKIASSLKISKRTYKEIKAELKKLLKEELIESGYPENKVMRAIAFANPPMTNDFAKKVFSILQ